MKYSKLITLLFIGMFISVNAQNASDQLFLTNGETIAVKIKKVEPSFSKVVANRPLPMQLQKMH